MGGVSRRLKWKDRPFGLPLPYAANIKQFAPANTGSYQSELMSFKSRGALLYGDYIRLLIADDNVGFESRNKKGATDLVNSMLNYGYSFLYPRIGRT